MHGCAMLELVITGWVVALAKFRGRNFFLVGRNVRP